MRRTANMQVGELARFCTDPQEAESLMKEAINWGLQQNKRTVRMIRLERLLRCGVGTTKVEKKCGERLRCVAEPIVFLASRGMGVIVGERV